MSCKLGGMMSETVIDVQDLSKRYHIGQLRTRHDTLRDALVSVFQRFGKQRSVDRHPTIWALKDVSFDIQQGQVVGVIGRNGAGKSTLLKILSQITDPTTGRIEIHGRVGSLLEVGTGFHPELTGRENILLNGAILGMSRAEIRRKFDEIVAFAEVEKFIDTPVKRYSSGMYVRLAFAVAAHLEPEILLVDEVLAVGDAAFQKKCLGKMGDVAKEGRTVVFISHNMAAITQLCHTAVWLEGGRIRKFALCEEVVKDYLSDSDTQIAERQWSYPGDAPGDDRVRLLAIRVLQQEQLAAVIDINLPSQIEIEFQVLKDIDNLLTGIQVDNMLGLCLFANC
ncbi:MAG TPA: polysaccharide ABC transporter ATP-binding protein, partial [Ktedonobacteraceae bacterium]